MSELVPLSSSGIVGSKVEDWAVGEEMGKTLSLASANCLLEISEAGNKPHFTLAVVILGRMFHASMFHLFK